MIGSSINHNTVNTESSEQEVYKNINLKDLNLSVGTIVEHVRFGKGNITKIEGMGADTKAEINFANGGLKKLLLRFAKLKVLD
jgi:DNA helicase-2/ATP-dependent DNA helicase PcrA